MADTGWSPEQTAEAAQDFQKEQREKQARREEEMRRRAEERKSKKDPDFVDRLLEWYKDPIDTNKPNAKETWADSLVSMKK